MPRGGGTLGLTYILHREMQQDIFIKTHLDGEIYQKDLWKEYEILNSVSKDVMSVLTSISIRTGETE